MQTNPKDQPRKPEKLYRLNELEILLGIRKSSIYAWMAEGLFPANIRLGARAVAWRGSEILAWQATRLQAVRGDGAK